MYNLFLEQKKQTPLWTSSNIQHCILTLPQMGITIAVSIVLKTRPNWLVRSVQLRIGYWFSPVKISKFGQNWELEANLVLPWSGF